MKTYFDGITDPRQQTKVKHNFVETIMMVICAVIAGCDVWEDIADYCRVKERWFRERLGMELAWGIPSHDTMSRIFGMLDPKEFQDRFIEESGLRETITGDIQHRRKDDARQQRHRQKTNSHGERMGKQGESGIWATGYG